MKRVITATIGLALLFAVLILGGVYLFLFLCILCGLGLKEFAAMLRKKGFYPVMPVVYASGLPIFLAALFNKPYLILGFLAVFIIITFLAIMKRNEKATTADTALTILCMIYGFFLPSHLLLLRGINSSNLSFFNLNFFNDGFWFIFIVFLVISISDIAGFYVGTNFGKHKLCPYLSPKKTIEGALGSTILGILASMGVGYLVGIDLLNGFLFGTLTVIAAQLGDLAESMMKRDAHTKDSGDILPGHGGIMDRSDSYMFTGAVAYYYILYCYPVIKGISSSFGLI